jgi:hypothetical protein
MIMHLSGWSADLHKLLLLLLVTHDLASLDPRGDSDGKKA